MTTKRVLVNTILLIVLVLAILWCFKTGKAHNIILENTPVILDGVEHKPFEAIYVSFGKDPKLMLEGDIIIMRAVGSKINMKVDVVDSDDKVLESRTISFTLDDIGEKLRLNVPNFYANFGK